MPHSYPSLSLIPLAADLPFYSGNTLPEVIHLESPALESFIDFKLTPMIKIKPDLPLAAALEEIKTTGINFLLIAKDESCLAGIITSRILQGRKPIEVAHEKDIAFADLTVAMLMISPIKMQALHYASLNNARIGHVLQTMQETNQDVLFVVEDNIDENDEENAAKSTFIRGAFSVSQLGKQLDTDINLLLGEAHSMLELSDKMR